MFPVSFFQSSVVGRSAGKKKSNPDSFAARLIDQSINRPIRHRLLDEDDDVALDYFVRGADGVVVDVASAT